MVTAYNALGDLLRRERLDLHQRELLLDTVIQTTPLVMVLTNTSGRVVYSNIAARQLFNAGRKLEGLDFLELLQQSPAPLREAVTGNTDTLFTMEVEGEPQVYHLSQRRFHLNAQPQQLFLLKQLTRELAAQEVAVWKKVIRVIAHELNNSLAPINSLAHSGRLLAGENAAVGSRVHNHRRPSGAPGLLHRRLCALRKAAAAATSGRRLGAVHRPPAGGDDVQTRWVRCPRGQARSMPVSWSR